MTPSFAREILPFSQGHSSSRQRFQEGWSYWGEGAFDGETNMRRVELWLLTVVQVEISQYNQLHGLSLWSMAKEASHLR